MGAGKMVSGWDRDKDHGEVKSSSSRTALVSGGNQLLALSDIIYIT